MEYLDKILHGLQSADAMAAYLAIIAEAALRLVKSQKPLGILHLVAVGAHKVADILEAFAKLSDKVLPQNAPAEVPPAPPAA